ncbi:membrane protein [Flavobacterium noncentrifugens]|uniref:Type IX secretion system membrane protein, PorP/SprF family n=1 Tax=Flavobacterium noncentrifugens TaxID=1128970 RepID=A0A1G8RVW6_9FLAO|nr:type IX secretion system membrane protein PorP/SprF [Flavobacterium noncentrifugens]GEP49587.1 membrane protein [Flavobacterium noncentrifugens]SDJ20645.1 type IX secretion system membrane protein, PorP/SprF family [Flavobacterium noncentrifugens]
MNFKKRYLLLVLFFTQLTFAQEGIAVYSDYLSDNYYLLHPSMAGAANCAKIRLTARQQWFGQDDAPGMQTLSFNGRIGEQSGGGIIAYNDKNGYHSQKGVKLSYAHHIMFSRDEIDLNQLSFGMSVGVVQSSLDETEFREFDPLIGGIVQKYSYFNVDVGMSYNYLDFYAHFTVKNAVETRRKIYTEYEDDNIRKFIFNTGYVFGDEENLLWEPSAMFQYAESTKEAAVDVNLKVYKTLEFGSLWGGLSYRRSLDGADYLDGQTVQSQKLQYITPILGITYNNFMVSYTYTHLVGDIKFDNGGFHQITLGWNVFCKKERYHCKCPAIN